jgi:hypothetical protein
MSAQFVFDDKDMRDFFGKINSRLEKVKDGKSEYVGLLSAIVFKDVMDHYEKEQGSKGSWKPWSKSYKDHMQKIGRAGNQILQFDGKLRQNFLPTNWKSVSDGIYWFNNAKTKSGYPYAAAHDDGSGRLPQRDFMWLSDKAIDSMSEQTLMFMMGEKGK